MYQVFLGVMPLPIAPSKITTTIGNRSQTVELIDGNEANIIRGAKLQEISFEAMIPYGDYPFVTLGGALMSAISTGVSNTAFLAYLEKLKAERTIFDFLCVRMTGGGKSALSNLYNTAIKVTLEDYTILEDANNGLDMIVNIRLKEYKPYGTKTYNDNGTVSKERP